MIVGKTGEDGWSIDEEMREGCRKRKVPQCGPSTLTASGWFLEKINLIFRIVCLLLTDTWTHRREEPPTRADKGGELQSTLGHSQTQKALQSGFPHPDEGSGQPGL